MRLPGLSALVRPVRRLLRVARTVRRTAEAVPDLVDAVLVLPTISQQLEEIRFSTATLPEMHAEIARVRGDTRALAEMQAALAQLAEIAVPLSGAATRVGRLADRWPAEVSPWRRAAVRAAAARERG